MLFPFPATARPEASKFTAFSTNTIRRDSENRADDCVEVALADPDAQLMLVQGGRLYLDMANGTAGLWRSRMNALSLGADLQRAVLLGTNDGRPLLAAPVSEEADEPPASIKAIDHRSVYMQSLLLPKDEGALAQGAGLLAWHASHRFCSRCGAESEMRSGGYKRKCMACGAEHFPRTDPVVIMLAVSEDACLLGRSAHFAPGMFSCLAGFVEPGETLEDAVRRETHEEAGIEIGQVAYHASQPWPFPYSLMIGCYGEALSHDIDADRDELEDCRWFTRPEVREMLGKPMGEALYSTPPKGAIAFRLISDWLDAG